MSVKLRFRRMGRKQLPVFGLVATDSRSPRDGRFIEDLGRYRPVAEPSTFTCDTERVLYWLGQGAQPSDTVRNLLQKEGILLRWALTRQGKEAEEIETAITEFKERQESKGAGAVKKTRTERRAEALNAERASAKEKAAQMAKERAEREAELEKQRQESEAAERAEAEEARAVAAAAAADSEALTTAADATAAPTGDADAKGDDAKAGGDSETPQAAVTGEAVEQTSSQADGDGDTADQQAETEAASGDAAVADASAADVADKAPDAAEQQPAAQDATTEQVAADSAQAMADQTEAGAEQADAITEAPATEAPDVDGTAGDVPTSPTPATDDTPATKDAPADAASSDKLTDISGIGPKYSGILTDAGITSFAQLAAKSVEEIQQIISDAGSSSAGSEDTWPEQAKHLAAGDTDAHAAYVDSLKS